MGYEDLITEANAAGAVVKELPLTSGDGRIKNRHIAIRKDILTTAKKADILAEELGHYHTTVGNILDQSTSNSRKQERTARLWAYNKRIGLSGIIEAYKHHCQSRYEMAEYLEVSEDTLAEALECYRQIYGTSVRVDNYIIRFEPYLGIAELF